MINFLYRYHLFKYQHKCKLYFVENIQIIFFQHTILADLEKRLKQLQEDNESLASRLAATTERPAAEGRENGIDDNVQKNVQLVEQTNLYV